MEAVSFWLPRFYLYVESFPSPWSILVLFRGFLPTRLFEAIGPKEFVFLVGEAQVANTGFLAPAARPGVDDGVADASVPDPAGLAFVQELDLPGGVELAHFGHRSSASFAGQGGFGETELAVGFEEEDFAWKRSGGGEAGESIRKEGVSNCKCKLNGKYV